MGDRCYDCDDHGHLATEHCVFEGGPACRCGTTPLWDVEPVNPCKLVKGS